MQQQPRISRFLVPRPDGECRRWRVPHRFVLRFEVLRQEFPCARLRQRAATAAAAAADAAAAAAPVPAAPTATAATATWSKMQTHGAPFRMAVTPRSLVRDRRPGTAPRSRLLAVIAPAGIALTSSIAGHVAQNHLHGRRRRERCGRRRAGAQGRHTAHPRRANAQRRASNGGHSHRLRGARTSTIRSRTSTGTSGESRTSIIMWPLRTKSVGGAPFEEVLLISSICTREEMRS